MDISKKEIKQMLESGDVREARDLLLRLNFRELHDLLMDIGFDNRDMISLYFLVLDMLGEREEIEIHRLALSLLSTPLCIISGAYSGAVYHLRKIIELEPDNVANKEHLLSFYTQPDRLISNEEAKSLAIEIIEVNSNSKIASEVLRKCSKYKDFI